MIQNGMKNSQAEISIKDKNNSKATTPIEGEERTAKVAKDADVESVEGKYKEMEGNNKAIIIENLNKRFD